MIRDLLIALSLAAAAAGPAAAKDAPKAAPARPAESHATTAAAPAPGSPDAVADAFFRTLQAGQTSRAYADMWAGTLMSKKQADVENLTNQTESILKIYGKIDGWEVMESRELSPSYVERTYLLRTVSAPLFFKFQFYHAPSGWLVAWLNFADSLKGIGQ